MDDVKRYDCNGRIRPMQENPDGPWMLYEDHRARLENLVEENGILKTERHADAECIGHLRALLAAVERERGEMTKGAEAGTSALSTRFQECDRLRRSWKSRAERAEAALATARRDAANIARSFSCCHVPDEIAALIEDIDAAAIRALANEAET